MILSDKTLNGIIKEQNTELVSPFNEDNLSPASIDLTLDSDFIEENGDRIITKTYKLKPGEFILATTIEKVKIPVNMVGIVKGKSSLARKGLMVECAGFVDPGFEGQITLEIKNLNSSREIVLNEYDKICQIVFMKLDSPAQNPYSNETGHHYQYQQGTARAWDDPKPSMRAKIK